MNIFIIVSTSPWGSTLGLTALRFAEQVVSGGDAVNGIFFHEDGVYHAQAGSTNEAGVADLTSAWHHLAVSQDFPLLVCQASARRRFPGDSQVLADLNGFSEAGLAQFLEHCAAADRVVKF